MGSPQNLFCGVIEKSFRILLCFHSKTKNLKIHLKKVATKSHGENSIKSLDFAIANQNPLCVFGFEDLTLTAGYNNLPVGYA